MDIATRVQRDREHGYYGYEGLLIAEVRRLRGMVDALLAAYLEGDYENGWEWDRVRQMRDWVE